MRSTLPALVVGLLLAQGAMAGDGTAAIGGGLGGALGNVVGQQLGGSTGAAIGAGVAGAAGSAAGARKGSRAKAAIGGGLGSAGGSLIGNRLGGSTGSTVGAGIGGAAGGPWAAAWATKASIDRRGLQRTRPCAGFFVRAVPGFTILKGASPDVPGDDHAPRDSRHYPATRRRTAGDQRPGQRRSGLLDGRCTSALARGAPSAGGPIHGRCLMHPPKPWPCPLVAPDPAPPLCC